MKGRFLVLCIAAVFIAGCVSQENKPANPELKRQWSEELWQKRHTFPDRIWEDSKTTFTEPNNLWLLGMAGAASIVMHNNGADDDIQDSVEHHRAIDGFFSESLNWIGNPGTHFAVTGLWYALAVDANDKLNENRAWTMMTALSINGLVTASLKAVRDNTTPNHDKWAWPSGHTSSSFCVAAVLDEFYGPKVGIPAYVAASFVGYRMIEEGDHWASDVVFGAALGWAVGHSVAGKHMNLEIAGFDLMPMPPTQTGEPTAGISFVKQF
ncbi:MAG: phosphatase PAP2 family protein [Sedimentisphaerales bacterium]|nr:phosphatase PAP2 family protein [Sedimentisphaerales bacterium]